MQKLTVLVVALATIAALTAWGVETAPSAVAHDPKAGADMAGVPRMLSHQGKLTTQSGNPVPDSTYNVTFRLFQVPNGGSPLWVETQSVDTRDGLFSILLGAFVPISQLPTDGNCYLEMQVSPDPPMTPRVRLVSSAYAYISQRSDTADYALQSSEVDSARVAADAHRLQGCDTAALNGRFVNEGQPGSIAGAMLQDGSVSSSKVQDGSLQVVDLAFTPVTRPLVPGVGSAEIGDTAVVSSKIKDGAVTSAKLAQNAVSSDKIQDGTIVRSDVASNFKAPEADTADYARTAPGAIDSARVAANSHRLQNKDTTDLDARYVNEGQPGAIANAMIRGDAVTSSKIQDGTIQQADLSFTPVVRPLSPGVSSAEIADGAVTTGKVADGNVTNAKLSSGISDTKISGSGALISDFNADKLDGYDAANLPVPGHSHSLSLTGAVSGSGQVPGSISTTLADGIVTSGKIVGGAVTSAKIQDYSIRTEDLDPSCKAPNADSVGGIAASRTPQCGKLYPLSCNGGLVLDYRGKKKGELQGEVLVELAEIGIPIVLEVVSDVTGIKSWVYGQATGTAVEALGGKYGVHATSTFSDGCAVLGSNSNSSGTGVVGVGNNVTPYYYVPQGSGGAFTGNPVGAFTKATSSSGNGIVGLGNNGSTYWYPTAGSGGAFTGTAVGAYAKATNSSSDGIVGIGNNSSSYWHPSEGCGGAFTGSTWGAFGHATNTSGDRYGGYFSDGNSWAYVGGTYNGSARKIIGNGTAQTVANTRNGPKGLVCPEMPEAYIEDVGSGQLQDGHCRVNLDPLLIDCITVSDQYPLRAFVQLEDNCKGVYVTKDRTGFDVYELQGGTSEARFSYRVLGKWKGYEQLRFENAPRPLEVQSDMMKTVSESSLGQPAHPSSDQTSRDAGGVGGRR